MTDLSITEEPDGSLTLTDGQHVETLDPFMAMATPRELLPAWFAERRATAHGEVDDTLAAGARAWAFSVEDVDSEHVGRALREGAISVEDLKDGRG